MVRMMGDVVGVDSETQNGTMRAKAVKDVAIVEEALQVSWVNRQILHR